MTEIKERKWEFTGLTLDMFRCGLCQELLVNPVNQVPTIGTVCSPCYERDHRNLQRARPVPELDKIIHHMCLTCPFEGCNAKLTMFEFQHHKELCLKTTTTCLYNDCGWTGRESCLAGHFIEEHEENVILSDCKGQFVFRVDTTSTSVYLFHKENGDKYFCKILALAPIPIIPRMAFQFALYEASHSFRNTNNCDLAVISINDEGNIDITEQLCVDRLSNAHDDNFISESHVSSEEMVELTVSILPIREQTDVTTVNELHYTHTRSLLECMVCKEFMTTPIFECAGGHGFCESCTSKKPKCPRCSNALTYRKRNFQMERMSRNISSYEQDLDANHVAKMSHLHI